MTIEQNKRAMKRFEKMINTNDQAIAQELISDTAAFQTPVSDKPLYGGKGYLSVVKMMRQSFSDVSWKLEEMVAEGDVVAVRWTCRGTHDGNFMGLPPTGKVFSISVMNFYHFNQDGKIDNDIAAEGLIGIFRALGLTR